MASLKDALGSQTKVVQEEGAVLNKNGADPKRTERMNDAYTPAPSSTPKPQNAPKVQVGDQQGK